MKGNLIYIYRGKSVSPLKRQNVPYSISPTMQSSKHNNLGSEIQHTFPVTYLSKKPASPTCAWIAAEYLGTVPYLQIKKKVSPKLQCRF